jgi:hypothetical protein
MTDEKHYDNRFRYTMIFKCNASRAELALMRVVTEFPTRHVSSLEEVIDTNNGSILVFVCSDGLQEQFRKDLPRAYSAAKDELIKMEELGIK